MPSQIVPVTNVMQSPHQHESFDDVYRPFFEKMSRVFAEVFPGSPEKWENDFRRDSNPEAEMAFWTRMARLYEHFTNEEEMGMGQKKDIFAVLMAYSVYGPKHVLRVVKPRHLSWRQVKEMVSDLTNGVRPLVLA